LEAKPVFKSKTGENGMEQSVEKIIERNYGPPDDPQRMTGTDVGVTKDGKLTALYVFIDPPSQK